MGKAIALFTGGITELREIAIREDGVVFARMQERHPRFGWRWSSWRATGEKVGKNAAVNINTMDMGFATLRRAHPNDCNLNAAARFNDKGEIRARLP